MKLFGGTKSVASVACLPFKDEPKVDFPPPVNKEVVKMTTVVSQNYTGLIVDCSGLGEINPVMSPVIKNADKILAANRSDKFFNNCAVVFVK